MIFKRKKLLLFIAIVVALLLCGYEFFDRQFSLNNISGLVSNVRIEPLMGEEKDLLKAVLNQPYAYLARGRQCYAFVSQDGQYVCKFFDLRRYKPHGLTSLLPSNPARMQKKMNRLLNGYKLAYEHDRDFSMILFLQLQPNASLQQQVTVTDRFGFKHVLDLDDVPFVIQRKAIPAREEITKLLLKDDLEGAKRRFRQLMEMYAAEHRQGIFDRDRNFMYNTGFVGEKPMRLDVGRLRADERLKNYDFSRQELDKIIFERAGGWLQRHFPQYREEILDDLQVN